MTTTNIYQRSRFTATSGSALQRDEAAQAQGESWGFSAGVCEREKPEDPGYLLLLAATRTKKGLNTFFLFDCKQKGDLDLLMTAMVTDSESQPSCGGKGFSKINTSWKI